jgi:capsid assembly protease
MRRTARKRRYIEASRLFGVPWLLTPAALRTLVASHQAVARSEDLYDDDEEEMESDYPIADGVACIAVSGILTKGSYWSTTCYSDIAANISHALNNSAVGGLLLAVDSPGGETADLFDLADAIYQARSIKPIVAVAADSCYSAAFCLASSAERLFVTRTGGTGSIGVWVAHTNYAGMLQQQGIDVEYVFSGSRKVDGNPTQPLSDVARDDLQKEVDRIRAIFAQTVARNRSVPEDTLMDTEAACFMSSDGIPLLCDEVGTINDAAAYLRGRIESVSPRSARRFISSGLSLPATQQPMIQHQIETESLYAVIASGKSRWADRELSREASTTLFGKEAPTAILAARCLPASRASVSSQASDRGITMLVVPYNDSANLGTFREVYAPGSFTQGLNNDLRVLFAHDERFVLGRTSAGTCRFWEAADGVHCHVDPVEAVWAEDVLASLRRKDITNASSCFWILKERWETRNGEKVRVIERALMREASVVSFSAYPATTATTGQAALPAAASQVQNDLEAARRRLEAATLPSKVLSDLDRARQQLDALR